MTEENVPNIRKEVEFEAFIDAIESGAIEHWQEIAGAIGVDKDTITEWRKHPRAKEAIKKGIEKCFNNMEKSGRLDWRMWREKLKMLGFIESMDLTSKGEKIEGLVIIKDGSQIN